MLLRIQQQNTMFTFRESGNLVIIIISKASRKVEDSLKPLFLIAEPPKNSNRINENRYKNKKKKQECVWREAEHLKKNGYDQYLIQRTKEFS